MSLLRKIYLIFIFPFYILFSKNEEKDIIKEEKVHGLVDHLNKYISIINEKYGKVDSIYENVYENGLTSYTVIIKSYDNINESELIRKTKEISNKIININDYRIVFSDLYFLSFFIFNNENEKDHFISDTMENEINVTKRFNI